MSPGPHAFGPGVTEPHPASGPDGHRPEECSPPCSNRELPSPDPPADMATIRRRAKEGASVVGGVVHRDSDYGPDGAFRGPNKNITANYPPPLDSFKAAGLRLAGGFGLVQRGRGGSRDGWRT